MDDVVEPKPTLAEKPPARIVTLLSDGSLEVEQEQVPLLDLQRMLLSAAANITLRTVQRAAKMERALGMIQARFDVPEDVERAIAASLSPGG